MITVRLSCFCGNEPMVAQTVLPFPPFIGMRINLHDEWDDFLVSEVIIDNTTIGKPVTLRTERGSFPFNAPPDESTEARLVLEKMGFGKP